MLDLVEEFRQPVVDRTVFALASRGQLPETVEGRLDDVGRRVVARKVIERLETSEPYEGKRHKLRSIIQWQARHLATFLRRERESYRAYQVRW